MASWKGPLESMRRMGRWLVSEADEDRWGFLFYELR
jgi:hypothetical protein